MWLFVIKAGLSLTLWHCFCVTKMGRIVTVRTMTEDLALGEAHEVFAINPCFSVDLHPGVLRFRAKQAAGQAFTETTATVNSGPAPQG